MAYHRAWPFQFGLHVFSGAAAPERVYYEKFHYTLVSRQSLPMTYTNRFCAGILAALLCVFKAYAA